MSKRISVPAFAQSTGPSGARSPRTPTFPYEWYETPNIHFLSVTDFERLAEKKGLRIDNREFLAGERRITWLPNLRAEVAVFLFG